MNLTAEEREALGEFCPPGTPPRFVNGIYQDAQSALWEAVERIVAARLAAASEAPA